VRSSAPPKTQGTSHISGPQIAHARNYDQVGHIATNGTALFLVLHVSRQIPCQSISLHISAGIIAAMTSNPHHEPSAIAKKMTRAPAYIGCRTNLHEFFPDNLRRK
jgi:hypothetical protein